MRFRVLGPVGADAENGPVGLGPGRQRTVLAVLLTDAGAAVDTDQLVDRVWGHRPPQRARQTLYTYLSRIRAVLADAGGPALVRRSGGYALAVDPPAVDLHRFRVLVAQARRAVDDARAAALWEEALGLWRGRPFADLDSDWLRSVAVGLEAERMAAVLDRTDLLLGRGEHARLLPELAAAVTERPMDERLVGQLMVALYRSGRQADALAQFRSLQGRLVEELGSDPGPVLRELHQRILRQDPGLAGFPATTGPRPDPYPEPSLTPSSPDSAGRRDRPAQLPADVPGFIGRDDDLRRLDALLAEESPRAVVITAIGGTAGVGKTALAVHWAHRVADRFPDGQLYVNLRGYDPEQPMASADVLAWFLTALGVTGQAIPLDVEERAARYRSELAGRRMLVVLDNAASVGQVRPLLPGSGSSLVVVTSRDSLAGLVAVHGAHRLDLDLLPAEEAVELLRGLVGSRVDAEPEAAVAMAEQCARLPLALRVAGELVVARASESLARMVAELAGRQQRLELLDAGGDPHAAVRVVFSWSTQHLPAEAVGMFRLLGLHPGPDLDPYAAAALAGTGPVEAGRVLEVLARAYLVHRSGPGRYGMHDLLRAYAAELAATDQTDPQRRAAEDRLLDHYLAAAAVAMDTLHPAEAHYRPKVPVSDLTRPDLTEPSTARAWLQAERPCLMAIVAHTAAVGRGDYLVDLVRIISRFLRGIYLTDLVTVNCHALEAADRTGDIVGQAHALRQLGIAYHLLGRCETSMARYQQAAIRFRQAGDLVGEALALTGLGGLAHRMGNHQDAVDYHRRSIARARQAHDRLCEAFGLCNLGIVKEHLGRYAEAADHHRRSLAILREFGAEHHEGLALLNLANAELRQGEDAAAQEHLQEALTIFRRRGSAISEAHAWDALGMLHVRRGEPAVATEHFQRALARFRRAGERVTQAWSLNGLGEAAQLAGRPADAVAFHTEALGIATETSTPLQEARAHAGLGHANRSQGHLDRARFHYERAYARYEELGMPESAEVFGRLGTLPR